MEKKDIPQDTSPLKNMTREVYYVKNSDGKYETGLSAGWVVKNEALENAWEDINEQVRAAKQAVLTGEKSPIYYYFVLQLMDYNVLSGYTGFWKFSIKKHMTSKGFKKLSDQKIEIYAKVFNITVDELKNFNH
ncbi:MAG: hypothetical protein COX70_10065 [Flavobacteriales bacterium CG_4_10_14_0_2_um_filter_32_8]|nr:MAG: hypothetical protein COX70_10065 [Flavobacteriales bacterium CG_4_10_14_0_2_um_filter_32_8]PJB15225.1 MAG: hypothetical protein CO118_04520 [Flavobacteriales bacterium CG_4_9_14_3_um_filter_32_8]